MRSTLYTAAIVLFAHACLYAQQPAPDKGDSTAHIPANIEESTTPETPPAAKLSETALPAATQPTTIDTAPISAAITKFDYRRPNANERFRNYIDDLAGPVAITFYFGTAGLLTARNSPKEWGAKWDGFGRRLGNQVAKGAIESTTKYGLDELLKVDSKFYRSRDRSVVARLRNSVFSTVTSRNRRGERVIGIPKIVGGLAAEVASSSGWYPNRYDYVHGLKGGAISLGINAGMNLFREFFWK